MSQRWSLVALAVLSLTTTPLVAAQGPVRMAADTETVVYDVSEQAAQNAELHRSLLARESAKGLARALEVNLTAAERAEAEAQVVDGRLRVGIEKPVGAKLLVGPSFRFGDATAADGSVVWTGRVVAPGATGIRLHLSPFDLPESAELYVYSADGQAYGPYTGRGPIDDGELWTNTVFGEEVRLQLRVAPEDLAQTRLVVAGLGYLGAGLPMATSATFCADNAACVVNAACVSNSAVNNARDAVASILFASGANYYICSGGLVADTDNSSVVPYFLTANHCISSSGEASSMETYFDYVTTCSNPTCTEPYFSGKADTVGAQIVKSNSTGDYTLLRLSSIPTTDNGVATYLGWEPSAVAYTTAHLYRLSHPKGSPQAYSEHVVDPSAPTCRSWPRGERIYSRDVVGATEGGSSGSPVVNASGNIVGQLSGACGYNVNDVCDSGSNATVDGAFASYYSEVAPYLNPAGGPSCSSSGASCSAASQCCSGTCRGRPGSKTCK